LVGLIFTNDPPTDLSVGAGEDATISMSSCLLSAASLAPLHREFPGLGDGSIPKSLSLNDLQPPAWKGRKVETEEVQRAWERAQDGLVHSSLLAQPGPAPACAQLSSLQLEFSGSTLAQALCRALPESWSLVSGELEACLASVFAMAHQRGAVWQTPSDPEARAGEDQFLPWLWERLPGGGESIERRASGQKPQHEQRCEGGGCRREPQVPPFTWKSKT
jgi:hypothetical protein